MNDLESFDAEIARNAIRACRTTYYRYVPLNIDASCHRWPEHSCRMTHSRRVGGFQIGHRDFLPAHLPFSFRLLRLAPLRPLKFRKRRQPAAGQQADKADLRISWRRLAPCFGGASGDTQGGSP